jgi:hypothetical protein
VFGVAGFGELKEHGELGDHTDAETGEVDAIIVGVETELGESVDGAFEHD